MEAAKPKADASDPALQARQGSGAGVARIDWMA
jgi:hypothetical protein